MTFEDIMELTYERNINGIRPSLSMEKAQKYYGY